MGQLIQQEISSSDFKHKACLFFPLLITELCLRTGVEVSSNNEVLPNSSLIDTIAIKIFAIPAAKPTTEQAPKAGNTGDIAAQVQHLTELMQQNLQQ